MKASERRVHLALTPIRAAIKGWAFGDDHYLTHSIAQAEGLAASLPADLQAEAEELIAPLRARLVRHGAAGA